MSKMKYKYIHECKKPSMVLEEKSFTTGFWLWKKVHTYEVFDTRQIKWTCDCGACWSWLSMGGRGFWMCDSRPEVWKDVEE